MTVHIKDPMQYIKSRVYYDKGRDTLVEILQVDKVTVQVRFVKDEAEDEFTKEEVASFILEGVWATPNKPAQPVTPAEPTQKLAPLPQKNTEEQKESLVAYVQSIKRLKEGATVALSLERQEGWMEVELISKPSKLEIDLNNLDPEDIKKLMSILNPKNKRA